MTESKSKKRKTVKLDAAYPYEELLMVRKAPECPQEMPELPKGFRLADKSEVPGLKDRWVSLMLELGFPFDEKEAQDFFESMLNEDPDFFCGHLYAILDEDQRLVSVVGIWPGRHVEDELRLHWMMSSPDFQSQGFGQKCLQAAMAVFDREYEGKDLYLSTQAQSWPAIRMYEKNGFEPYMGESRNVGADENRRRWERTADQVYLREGVRI